MFGKQQFVGKKEGKVLDEYQMVKVVKIFLFLGAWIGQLR